MLKLFSFYQYCFITEVEYRIVYILYVVYCYTFTSEFCQPYKRPCRRNVLRNNFYIPSIYAPPTNLCMVVPFNLKKRKIVGQFSGHIVGLELQSWKIDYIKMCKGFYCTSQNNEYIYIHWSTRLTFKRRSIALFTSERHYWTYLLVGDVLYFR